MYLGHGKIIPDLFFSLLQNLEQFFKVLDLLFVHLILLLEPFNNGLLFNNDTLQQLLFFSALFFLFTVLKHFACNPPNKCTTSKDGPNYGASKCSRDCSSTQ